MVKSILQVLSFSLLYIFFPHQVWSQANPVFTVIPEVCISENLVIQNQSLNAATYKWDFCHENLLKAPEVSFSATVSGANVPEGVEMAYDKGSWFGFVSSRDNNKIFRLEYGNSLFNTPVIVDMGNIGGVVNGPKTIKLVNDKGNWYGFLVNYGGSNLVRLDFGTSLASMPSGTNLGNLDGWSTLRGIDIEPVGTDWVIVVSSFNNNKVTIIKLQNSVTYIPTPSDKVSISNSLISGPMGLDLVEHEGNWYSILVSQKNNKLLHLDFGADVFSVPVVSDLGTVSKATDAKLIREGSKYVGFASGATSGLFRVNLGAVPQFKNTLSIEKVGDFGIWNGVYTMGVVRHNPDWSIYALSYTDKKLHRLYFKENGCAYVNLSNSNDFEPVGLNYTSSGTYSISLTAYDEKGNRNELAKTIIVTDNQAPTVDFITDNACLANTNVFSVQNFTPDQTITSYTWTFPDGSQQSGAEVSHQFIEPGSYQVKLHVKSENGCGNFVQKEVKVYPEPQAAFSLTESLICSNAPVTFTNQINFPEESVITYSWDFGDGTTSAEKSPEHVFSAGGTYTVTLSASIPGCTATSTQTVEVKAGPQTLFEAQPVCNVQKVVFLNQTTGENITSYEWDLGDGTFSNLENPEHIYDAVGTYLVQLKTANALGCVTSYTQSVRVYSIPEPDFSVGPSCAENEILFRDASIDADGNIEAWEWEFEQPDGTLLLSEEQNPVVTYKQPGTYEVVLTTTTTWLCQQTIRKEIVVDPVPVVAIGLEGGCLGAPSILADLSEPGALKVQSWYWSIGGEVYTDSAFTYTFPDAGTYEVFLQLNLENGCSVKGTRQIIIDPLPEVDFSWTGTCPGQTAAFSSSFSANTYEWTLDGEIVSSEAGFEHTFSALGAHTVQLTVVNEKGCTNTVSNEVEVGEAPVAAFSADKVKGVSPFIVNFTNSSAGGVEYQWFFDDVQQSSSKVENPIFTFGDTRDYQVRLVAFNAAGCSDTTTQLISVVEGKYDVALSAINLLQQNGQMQLVLGLENGGTIAVTSLEINVLVNNEYALAERFEGNIEMGEQENYSLNMQLLENSKRKLRFVCVELKPHLTLVNEELSVANNKMCFSFDNTFVMHEPFPNPVQEKVTLEYLLPQPGTVSVWLYSADGKLVQQAELQNQQAGLNHYDIQLGGMGKGIYFVKARFGGEEVNYRIMKD